MHHRPFGQHPWSVSEIGFGAWAIGGSWGDQADTDSLSALHSALDLGCAGVGCAPRRCLVRFPARRA